LVKRRPAITIAIPAKKRDIHVPISNVVPKNEFLKELVMIHEISASNKKITYNAYALVFKKNASFLSNEKSIHVKNTTVVSIIKKKDLNESIG